MVRIENLDFSYKKNKPVLKEITLNFAKEEYMVCWAKME